MRYVAQWKYWSGLCERFNTGPLDKGREFDLDPKVAAAFNRDSPGVLKAWEPPKERHVTTAKTRQVTSARTRASKAAVELAEEEGVDLALVEGSGVGGKVTKPDVEALLEDD